MYSTRLDCIVFYHMAEADARKHARHSPETHCNGVSTNNVAQALLAKTCTKYSMSTCTAEGDSHSHSQSASICWLPQSALLTIAKPRADRPIARQEW